MASFNTAAPPNFTSTRSVNASVIQETELGIESTSYRREHLHLIRLQLRAVVVGGQVLLLGSSAKRDDQFGHGEAYAGSSSL
ncbi:hypothetical protein J5X84_41875 [Streptosporangiaceae bacterium NEAU-GS5]|nr:hypothetical protein [Streptosporangiaceae bacterium NEAU-GS5]